ncbi:suppressor of npr1-1 [Spatholobus suberectus]|nr:suppressor of npr1-1 [Spatholobus suberectus]
MSISRIQIPPYSTEGIFKFHLTNSQQLDPTAHANIVDDAWLKITEDEWLKSVFFCFPGSAVPRCFPCRGEGDSATIITDSLNLGSDNRLIGFAFCVVVVSRRVDVDDTMKWKHGFFSYRLKFESDDGINTLLQHDELGNHVYWKGQERLVYQDHTLLWKYQLESTSMSLMLSHAHSFTLEISCERGPHFRSIVTVKECGICPLYTKRKYNAGAGACADGDYSGFWGFPKNDIENPNECSIA